MKTKHATQVEVEDCAGMSKKIEQIAARTKFMERALEAIADKLWQPEVCWLLCTFADDVRHCQSYLSSDCGAVPL